MPLADLVPVASQNRWNAARAREWYASLPWLVGCNYIPASAINQLEMWQAETFSPEEINLELSWLAALGMNSLRVFLHNLPWEEDSIGFLSRIERFLDLAQRHGMGVMFVFFDSVWDPAPLPGRQRAPKPGVHNSGWVQSPGLRVLKEPAAFAPLEGYVTGVVRHFRNDSRVQVWDIWNEPENPNTSSYAATDLPLEQKSEIVYPLLARAFQWVRSVAPTQPVTSGIWRNMEAPLAQTLTPLSQLQISCSDVISFHAYTDLTVLTARVRELQTLGRPLLCTEYLARGVKSTFEAILPFFKQERIAAYNWGAVAGKTQTICPWDSWEKPYLSEPMPWHHDILRADGRPYREEETALIRSLTHQH